MDRQPIVSICIPTFNRPDLLKEVIESVIQDGVNINRYEIVVSDNSIDGSARVVVEDFFNTGVNCRYVNSQAIGYLNSVSALELGRGYYLKLQNDYTLFKKGKFSNFIDYIEANIIKNPVIFYTNGSLRKYREINLLKFKDFVEKTGYLHTWSSGFGIWKEDFEKTEKRKLNRYFPHTSLLFAMHEKKEFKIQDEITFTNIEVEKKGGYKLFKVFCIDYINMLYELVDDSIIDKKNVLKIKSKMKYFFIAIWHSRTISDKVSAKKYTFEIDSFKDDIKIHFSRIDVFNIVLFSEIITILRSMKRAIRKKWKI
jgi:glycosyltransferase involved in cell wall biosynthesis